MSDLNIGIVGLGDLPVQEDLFAEPIFADWDGQRFVLGDMDAQALAKLRNNFV